MTTTTTTTTTTTKTLTLTSDFAFEIGDLIILRRVPQDGQFNAYHYGDRTPYLKTYYKTTHKISHKISHAISNALSQSLSYALSYNPNIEILHVVFAVSVGLGFRTRHFPKTGRGLV